MFLNLMYLLRDCKMTYYFNSCEKRKCKHYLCAVGPKEYTIFTCEAFPGGIPEDVTSGRNLHNKPIAGDNGITYSGPDKNGDL